MPRPTSSASPRTGQARCTVRAPHAAVPASLLQLIYGRPRNPACIQNRNTDYLAANILVTTLTPNRRPGVQCPSRRRLPVKG
ncbi:hypothetical protein AV521_42210 [Streptomyces sp. IMTB 2501]|uniref:hypothetical protein n=1 Tax=Streptomyces sp. IMTB 2501 TaxID=1776340 RepID=UPI00096F6B9E|nr:hypothetical protein [Streptomyces sp. IMTB 2501]OLZ62316.1 hypothetical protein AV521_42210 [Streptomyces sp. IMTB 2501]